MNKTLARYDTPFGVIKVVERKDTVNYFQNGLWMSMTMKDGKLPWYEDYNGYIFKEIKQYKKILILGCAGGTIVNQLTDTSVLDVIDINLMSFVIAKKWFKLNPKANCITSCAAEYVNNCNKKYDAVVVDVFDGKGKIPDALRTDAFMKSLLKITKHKIIFNTCSNGWITGLLEEYFKKHIISCCGWCFTIEIRKK